MTEMLFVEVARQAPQLTVLGVIVWRFLHTIGIFAEQQGKNTEVLRELTDAVRSLNGHQPAGQGRQSFGRSKQAGDFPVSTKGV